MMEKELVQKYFEGRCTAEELASVLRWLNDDKADHALLQRMMEGHWEQESLVQEGEELKPRLLARLQQQLYAGAANKLAAPLYRVPVEEPAATPVIPLRKKLLRYGMVACVAGLLLLAAWAVIYYKQSVQAVQWNTVANTGAGIKYCVLPDGSKVWLSQGSTLAWAAPFADRQRNVRIEGQAFFDVARDEQHPFTVQSGSVITRVLGTAFNIEAYIEEKEIRVSLVNGKVAVQRLRADATHHTQSDTITEILNAGEILTYVKETGGTTKEELQVTTLTDWTSGHLVFSEVPVKVALARLARLYHLQLHFQEGVNLDKNRFSTVFTTETPEQMIKNILFITDYTCRISGKEVEILKK